MYKHPISDKRTKEGEDDKYDSTDNPTSSALTQERLGWRPVPTLDRPTAENAPIPEANQQILVVPDAQKSSEIDASVFKSIIGLAVVLLLGLLIFIYKKISYKHDYYDC